ncbi:hypothetical protein ACFS2C_23275 [Prauserella oleivorans]|uniref:Uncharacterized protein n=1 Tax=Prauserella oleivorans TaxID=1478153 RepID=A0ABW5WIU2_9PSEU
MWLDGKQLMATECKHWSSCSRGFVTVGNVEAAALRAWELLQEHLGQDVWTETNKISIPLCPPVDPPWGTDEHAAAKIMRSPRRMLAIWAPISEDGVSFFSRTTTPGDIAGMPVQVRIEVFSVSLYLRHLQGHGITRLPSGLPDIDDTLAAIDAMTIR